LSTPDPTPNATPAPLLALIGGSGLYDLPGLTDTRWVTVDTPWGAPSDQVFRGRLATAQGSTELAFLPRHGRGHRIPPSEVNYRANVAALKMLGATDVLSLSAVGGLRADLPPGSFVIVDQFIDRTHARAKSFFGTGLVGHVSMADPVCGRLGSHVQAALREQGVPHVRGGTYLTIEGPHLTRELALIKVVGRGEDRMEVLRLADAFRARVVDATTESFVLEMTGNADKIDAFVALMRPIGLAEVSRTGAVAIARGPKGIME
jgi:purine nucleoside phosphorylase